MRGAECPECGSVETRTIVGGWDVDGQRLRQRTCECGYRFVTVEVPVLLDDGQPIPYSWLDEEFRRSQREKQRLVPRKGGRSYRGFVTKAPIEGVARLLVKVRVKLEKGMRPDARHGSVEPLERLSDPSIAPQRLVPVDDRKRIARRYLAGTPTETLAREYRISKRTVQRYIRHYGRDAA